MRDMGPVMQVIRMENKKRRKFDEKYKKYIMTCARYRKRQEELWLKQQEKEDNND